MAYKIDIREVADYNNDGAEDMYDVDYILRNKRNTLSILKGDGDFRSEECLALLDECDIVVTNHPFSLFRDFITTVTKHNKDLIVIGNVNAIVCKEIFLLIKENRLYLGNNKPAPKTFVKPDNTTQDFGNIIWFTTLKIEKRGERLLPDLYKKYTPEEFPHYDNYDAINVNKVSDIPIDYYGVMGVPITFLDKYNPDEFEILGCSCSYADCGKHYSGMSWNAMVDGKNIYKRFFIKRKRG